MRRMKSGSRKLKSKAQLWLDVGCGEFKKPDCVGMDVRRVKGVDVVHDCEVVPWPFAGDTFTRVIMSHLVEHLKPWLIINIMDEVWRILKPGGILMLAMPYAGSFGHWQDPTHIRPWNEATATYFDPDKPLYGIYKPKPWKIEANVWRNDGNLEIVLRKRDVKAD